jgi:hypothetical protein
MMDEFEDNDLLLAYVEGDLSPDEAARMEERLGADKRLAALVEQLRSDRRLLGQWPREDPPVELVDRIMRQRERSLLLGDDEPPPMHLVQGGSARTNRLAKTVAYAAIAAAVLLCASVMMVMLPDAQMMHKAAQSNDINGELAMRRDNLADRDKVADVDGSVATAQAEADEIEDVATLVALAEPAVTAPPLAASKAGPRPATVTLEAAAPAESEAIPGDEAAIVLSGKDSPAGGKVDDEYRVEIVTDSTLATVDDLNRWARSNFANVYVQDGSRARGMRFAKQSDTEAREIPAKNVARQQVIVEIKPHQVSQLMVQLNSRAGQRAELVGNDSAFADADTHRRQRAEVMAKRPCEQPARQAISAGTGSGIAEESFVSSQALPAADRMAEMNEKTAGISVTNFFWGGVLENQLPLISQTSIASLHSVAPLRLPIWINQAAPLDESQDLEQVAPASVPAQPIRDEGG